MRDRRVAAGKASAPQRPHARHSGQLTNLNGCFGHGGRSCIVALALPAATRRVGKRGPPRARLRYRPEMESRVGLLVVPAARRPAAPRLARLRLADVDLTAAEVRPFSPAMALSASIELLISTNPNPRERPVSRSVTTVADSQVPEKPRASWKDEDGVARKQEDVVVMPLFARDATERSASNVRHFHIAPGARVRYFPPEPVQSSAALL